MPKRRDRAAAAVAAKNRVFSGTVAHEIDVSDDETSNIPVYHKCIQRNYLSSSVCSTKRTIALMATALS